MHMLSFKDSSNPFEFIETIWLLNISYVFKGDESLIWLVPFSTQSFFTYSQKGILQDTAVILVIGLLHKMMTSISTVTYNRLLFSAYLISTYIFN